ncbi:hypothetical protein HOK51_09740 [Candidatus Woesearchaeota archaeon]|jgi:hypothetical protein|nr:hypothetical protein [Candidatus Woesearchaeota archaeon]MBT7366710.1 hypothetical protein [Candidatus Woesearchaeota archaeon]
MGGYYGWQGYYGPADREKEYFQKVNEERTKLGTTYLEQYKKKIDDAINTLPKTQIKLDYSKL